MKAKYFLGFLPVLILTAGIALAQQPAPPPEPPGEPADQNFETFFSRDGFLGVYAENISRENMGRYHVSQVRGVGVTRIVTGSPAEKAGLRKDDVILRIDGENVTSVRKLNRLVSELAPDQNVRVTFSRGGAEQEVTATVAKRSNSSFAGDLFGREPRVWKFERGDPKAWKFESPLINRGELFDNDGDFSFVLGNSRRIGVSTMELSKQLADYFGITGGKGVLVTSVTDDGPAAKAGVRAGDVITAVDGEAVDSPGDISRVINRKKDGEVALTIVRNKSQQTIRVMPREGGSFGTAAPSQTGRRIVIPRIVIPTIPDIDIRMPSIDINLPRIRVTPGARIRTSQGPI
jgi:membrane-associated protease RseP (regulator of RpoE activity)